MLVGQSQHCGWEGAEKCNCHHNCDHHHSLSTFSVPGTGTTQKPSRASSLFLLPASAQQVPLFSFTDEDTEGPRDHNLSQYHGACTWQVWGSHAEALIHNQRAAQPAGGAAPASVLAGKPRVREEEEGQAPAGRRPGSLPRTWTSEGQRHI